MDITKLKSGWGYKKSSVYEYIAETNENFSSRLIDMVRDYDKRAEELSLKISQLEAENVSVREERDRIAAELADTNLRLLAQQDKAEKENAERAAETDREQTCRNELPPRMVRPTGRIDRLRKLLCLMLCPEAERSGTETGRCRRMQPGDPRKSRKHNEE